MSGRGAGAWLPGLLVGLFALVVWLVVRVEARLLRPVATSASLEQRVEELSARVRELEAAQRALTSERLWEQDPRTSLEPAVQDGFPRTLSGKPDGPPDGRGGAPAPLAPEPWKTGLIQGLRRGQEWKDQRPQDGPSSGEPPVAAETAVQESGREAPAGAEEPGEEPAEEPTEEPGGEPAERGEETGKARGLPQDLELVVALNQLLEDCGLTWYRLVEGHARLEEPGVFDVLLTENPGGGGTPGTIEAGRMLLRLDARTETAQLVLQDAFSRRDGVRVEHPGRRLVLDVPGRLPLSFLPDPLPWVFAVDGSRPPVVFEDAEPRLADRLNRLLEDEGLPLEVRSVERHEAGLLLGAVFVLTPLPGETESRVLHAATAWFELEETAALLSLVCEGGELEVAGVRRPLFRGHFRRTWANVRPQEWRAAPGVVRSTLAQSAEALAPAGG